MARHSKWADIRRRERVQARRADAGEAAPVRYEGYGPGGGAVLVDCASGSAGERVRQVFLRYGGNLGAEGSVSYLFNTVGVITYAPDTDAERLTRVALDAGAEDVVPDAEGSVEVLADPLEFAAVRAALTRQGFAPVAAEITERAANSLELCGEAAELMVHLLRALEGLDEVSDVYSNVEISDEVLARV